MHHLMDGKLNKSLIKDFITVKFRKFSPGAYIFSKALFEGLIFRGAYIRRGLCTEGNMRCKLDWASV